MALTIGAVFFVLVHTAGADTIRKTIEEHHSAKETSIRSHDASEEEMPSVTLRRADFNDHRTKLSAFSDRKASVRKATADRDGKVVMSVDWDGDAQQEQPDVHAEADHAEHFVEAIVCDEGHWQCKDGSACVRHSVLCDGLADCVDHSDEETEACKKGSFAQVLAHAAVKAEVAKDPREQKRYEVLSIPGYIPPPREHYEEFWAEKSEMVKRFPRVTDTNNTKIEVWFVQAPISNVAMASAGATHTGLAFVGRDRNTNQELFRRDFQYWAASFSKAHGPSWLKNGNLELNEAGDRVAFRARAVVTSARTHGKFSDDWGNGGSPEKMTDIDGHKYNEIMDFVEDYGRKNKYYQPLRVMRGKELIQPDVTCHLFVAKVLTMAMDVKENYVWEDRRVALQRTTYMVSQHQLTRDPLRCLAPYVDPIDGVGSVLDKAHMYNARFLFSFFMGKKLTLPQRYMADGSALEESDFPAECQEFRVKKIVTEYSGAGVDRKEEFKAPQVPTMITKNAIGIDKMMKNLNKGVDTFTFEAKENLAKGFAKDAMGEVNKNPILGGVKQATKSVLEIIEDRSKATS